MERVLVSYLYFIRTPVLSYQGPTVMSSFNSVNSIKFLSSNTVTLGVRALTYELVGGDTIQSITRSKWLDQRKQKQSSGGDSWRQTDGCSWSKQTENGAGSSSWYSGLRPAMSFQRTDLNFTGREPRADTLPRVSRVWGQRASQTRHKPPFKFYSTMLGQDHT